MRRLFSALAQAPPALTQTFKSRLSFDACTSTDVDRLEAEAHRLACYAGFDPTSDRLHLGNLLQIVSLVRSSMHGFTPIYLLGGATGMIGDPSGKSSERNLLETALLEANKASVSKNLHELEASIRSHLTSNADRYGLTRELPVQSADSGRQASGQPRLLQRHERPQLPLADWYSRLTRQTRARLHAAQQRVRRQQTAQPGRHQLHRVLLPAAPSLRLPAAAPATRTRDSSLELRPAARRQRPVGQYSIRRRAGPQNRQADSIWPHHASAHHCGRQEVREERSKGANS